MGESEMMAYRYAPAEGPRCERCGATMHLVRIDPESLGYIKRTFRCRLCWEEWSSIIRCGIGKEG
jgi:hypothetical protein